MKTNKSEEITLTNILLPGTVKQRLTGDSKDTNSIEYVAGRRAKELGYHPYEDARVTIKVR